MANNETTNKTSKTTALGAQWNELIDARLAQLEKGLSDPAILARGKDAQASFKSNTARKQKTLRLVRRLMNNEPLTAQDTEFLVALTSDTPVAAGWVIEDGMKVMDLVSAHKSASYSSVMDHIEKAGFKVQGDKIVKA